MRSPKSPRITPTSVLFELIAARYEHRSMPITANQPFGEWGKILPDQAMTLAAIDCLVHHATILEMKVESYHRKAALHRRRDPGRPPKTLHTEETRKAGRLTLCDDQDRQRRQSAYKILRQRQSSSIRPLLLILIVAALIPDCRAIARPCDAINRRGAVLGLLKRWRSSNGPPSKPQ